MELIKYLLRRKFDVDTWTLDRVSKQVVAFDLTYRILAVTQIESLQAGSLSNVVAPSGVIAQPRSAKPKAAVPHPRQEEERN